MAFTYPPQVAVPGSLDSLTDVSVASAFQGQPLIFNGTNWVPGSPGAGSLLAAQYVIENGPGTYVPRVTVLSRDNTQNPIRDGYGLPLMWPVPMVLDAIRIPYFGNTSATGTYPWSGQKYANPGWQVRAYVYATDLNSGLPTNLLFSTQTSVLNNTDNGGTENGILTLDIAGNYNLNQWTPIWVAIVSQPLFVEEFPEGWDPNQKYDFVEGVWVVDNENGGYLSAPSTYATVNQLSPIAALPQVPWEVFQWGNPFGKNSIRYHYGAWNYDGEGGQTATDISTWSGHGTWPNSQNEWPPMSGNIQEYSHSPSDRAIFFFVTAWTQAWD